MPDAGIMLAAPGCKAGDKSTKNLNTWSKKTFYNAKSRKAYLQCGVGDANKDNVREGRDWGWRHISGKHGGDFANIIAKYPQAAAGSNVTTWDGLAKVAIQKALSYSQAASSNSSGSNVAYSSGLEIKRNGKVVRTYMIVVWVKLTDNRIQSAYPGS
ncbi:hypothetical protein [Frigoribacterium faeni]|uniref:Uncharacterized protein n=1 Tax=Frigoribacterium faeni TaxID=145483 RepID=A0A7W3JJ56_9MICO|nr:hypothetical protein [Frigoribacterium faeni]MBA8813709.1 hypothetical protein [Frigoribacterium faeni]BFF15003.1 hypothetical protein GCM10025699_63060 [Microbacterium flavescens]GEK83356.1 hypothetical protein FFA01_16650 [Frigoribacterium faeni]